MQTETKIGYKLQTESNIVIPCNRRYIFIVNSPHCHAIAFLSSFPFNFLSICIDCEQSMWTDRLIFLRWNMTNIPFDRGAAILNNPSKPGRSWFPICDRDFRFVITAGTDVAHQSFDATHPLFNHRHLNISSLYQTYSFFKAFKE